MARRKTIETAAAAPAAPAQPSRYGGRLPLMAEARTLTAAQLFASPLNPRKIAPEPEALAALCASIVAEGVLEPLLARPGAEPDRFEIICGERRWRAVGLAIAEERLPELYPIPVRVRGATDAELVEIAAVENIGRVDMHPLDEAEAIGAMRRYHKDDAEIARRLGIPERTFYRRAALLRCAPGVKDALREGKLSLQQAAAYALGDAAAQEKHLRARGKWQQEPHNIRRLLTEKRLHVDRALFPLEQYQGEIVEDAASADRYLVDVEQAQRLNDAVIEAKLQELKAKWPWAKRLAPNEGAWNFPEASKKDKEAGAILWVDHTGLQIKAPVLTPGILRSREAKKAAKQGRESAADRAKEKARQKAAEAREETRQAKEAAARRAFHTSLLARPDALLAMAVFDRLSDARNEAEEFDWPAVEALIAPALPAFRKALRLKPDASILDAPGYWAADPPVLDALAKLGEAPLYKALLILITAAAPWSAKHGPVGKWFARLVAEAGAAPAAADPEPEPEEPVPQEQLDLEDAIDEAEEAAQ